MKPELIKTEASSNAGGYKATTALLQLINKPIAIFVADELMTLGAIDTLNKHDIDYIHDIKLIGLSNSEWSNIVNPNLSVLSIPSTDIGIIATKTIIDIAKASSEGKVPNTYLPTELIIKD